MPCLEIITVGDIKTTEKNPIKTKQNKKYTHKKTIMIMKKRTAWIFQGTYLIIVFGHRSYLAFTAIGTQQGRSIMADNHKPRCPFYTPQNWYVHCTALVLLLWFIMYMMSHTICTRYCYALLCCGHIMSTWVDCCVLSTYGLQGCFTGIKATFYISGPIKFFVSEENW